MGWIGSMKFNGFGVAERFPQGDFIHTIPEDRTLLGQKPVYLASFATDGTTFVTASFLLKHGYDFTLEIESVNLHWQGQQCKHSLHAAPQQTRSLWGTERKQARIP